MTTLKLKNGVEMPLFGLGTLQSSSEECINAIHAALDAGYKLIDTAFISKNEEDVGKALESYFETGKLSRKDVFITTRFCCDDYGPRPHPEDVEKTLIEKLKALRTDYVDLYLIQLPPESVYMVLSVTGLEPTWKAMEEVYKKGLAKSIGCSNFSQGTIEDMLSTCEVPFNVLQLEQDSFFQQFELVECCQEFKIPVITYVPHDSSGMMKVRFDEF